MKKILVSLLTVAMLFTIGATNVLAEEQYYGESSGIGNGFTNDEIEGQQFNTDERNSFMTVDLYVKKATPPSSHGEYFGSDDNPNPNTKAVYKLEYTWEVNGGWYTEQAEWKWNPETAQYVNTSSAGYSLDHVPNVTLKVKNKSNKDVWYKVRAEEFGHLGFTAQGALVAFDQPYSETRKFDALAVNGTVNEVIVLDHVNLALNNDKQEELNTALSALGEREGYAIAKVFLTLYKEAPEPTED